MKVKQEIIKATYDLEDLTQEEYELLKDGLLLLQKEDCILGYSKYRDGSRSNQANEMLKKLNQ